MQQTSGFRVEKYYPSKLLFLMNSKELSSLVSKIQQMDYSSILVNLPHTFHINS